VPGGRAAAARAVSVCEPRIKGSSSLNISQPAGRGAAFCEGVLMESTDLYRVKRQVDSLEFRVAELEKERRQRLEEKSEQARAEAERQRVKTNRVMYGTLIVFWVAIIVLWTVIITKAIVEQ
jgi:uncharacterized membrane protein YcjF (UPF0283 family)